MRAAHEHDVVPASERRAARRAHPVVAAHTRTPTSVVPSPAPTHSLRRVPANALFLPLLLSIRTSVLGMGPSASACKGEEGASGSPGGPGVPGVDY